MSAYRNFFLLLFCCLGLYLPSQAQLSSVFSDEMKAAQIRKDFDPRQVKIDQLESLMNRLYEMNQFNGCVMVLEQGELLYKKALGWSNYEKRDTLTTNTPFRLASVSKQFTAMAIMMLREEGKLNYDDPITKYLPELPYKQVTIRNLLQHNSGIPDYFAIGSSISAYYSKKMLVNNDDLVKYFAIAKPKLHFVPGKKASYSNTGYVFLASIVERVSEVPFAIFLQSRIFDPLEMNDTFIYNTKNYTTKLQRDTVLVSQDTVFLSSQKLKINTNFRVETSLEMIERPRAFGYMHSNTKAFAHLDYHKFDGMAGEKSVCASAEDLIKWDRALHANRLVSDSTLREAFRPHAVSNRRDYGYGFGWKIYSKDHNIVFHHGLYRGFRNYFQRTLDDRHTIVILSNRQIGRTMVPILDAINRILDGKKYKVPKPNKMEKNSFIDFRQNYHIDY